MLLPFNFVMRENERYRAEFEAVCALCEERNVAVQTIKSIARGPWATTEPDRNTWYQPFETREDIDRAVHWVLGKPGIFLNTVGDLDLLPAVLDAAGRFASSPGDDALRAMTNARRATALFGIGT